MKRYKGELRSISEVKIFARLLARHLLYMKHEREHIEFHLLGPSCSATVKFEGDPYVCRETYHRLLRLMECQRIHTYHHWSYETDEEITVYKLD